MNHRNNSETVQDGEYRDLSDVLLKTSIQTKEFDGTGNSRQDFDSGQLELKKFVCGKQTPDSHRPREVLNFEKTIKELMLIKRKNLGLKTEHSQNISGNAKLFKEIKKTSESRHNSSASNQQSFKSSMHSSFRNPQKDKLSFLSTKPSESQQNVEEKFRELELRDIQSTMNSKIKPAHGYQLAASNSKSKDNIVSHKELLQKLKTREMKSNYFSSRNINS